MWTCNRLDLQTPGSQPVMPKNLPDHLASREVSSGKYQKFGTRISHQVPNGYPPEREGDPKTERENYCIWVNLSSIELMKLDA